jgi:phenylacetate-coenzyme A ligase PaaK-like adenylate-forming protein
MAGALLRKLRGNAVIAAHLIGQARAPFAPRERIEALRDRRVRRMVRYAARHVPHYREWFAQSGLDPRRIRRAADLALLPILDRDQVRAEPRRFVAETAAARDALEFATSGSTGIPVRVLHDRRSLLANFAWGERERAPAIAACDGAFRPSELYVGYETSTFKKVTAFYQESTLLPVQPKRRFVSLLEPIEDVVALANQLRPDLLVGYGGWIDLFFRTVAARGLTLRPPRLVLYMGEALPHGARSHIEEGFGIPVLSRYNAVEAFKIGFVCEHRRGFHLHEDLCHVRIVDAGGRDLAHGESGRVVLSNLVNRATVLLNYPIGDLASISAESCPCGRTQRLLSELEGRVEDILPLEDGRFVHPRAVWETLKGERGLLQYQLTQHERRRFSLRLVTLDEASFERIESRARAELGRLLGPGSVLEVERQAELDRRAGGKFRAVRSLSPRSEP